jgi:predicted aconitase
MIEPPRDLADWGALGALIGRDQESYWQVPIIEVAGAHRPGSDELKHLGAAMASWGSSAMFHLCGAAPEAPDADPKADAVAFGHRDIEGFYASFAPSKDDLDVVVFAALQRSLLEMAEIARMLQASASPTVRRCSLRPRPRSLMPASASASPPRSRPPAGSCSRACASIRCTRASSCRRTAGRRS